MRRLIIALQFLTWIKIRDVEVDDDSFARSMVFYPLVGLIIGAVLVGVCFLIGPILPAGVAAALLLMVEVGLSGGLHLDGFMDTMDGLFSGRSRERTLEIMKDSRVGAHSVIALSSLLLLKYSLFVSLISNAFGPGGWGFLAAFLVMPAAGRWAMTWAICRYPYGRESGLGKVYGGRVGNRELAVTSVYTLALFLIIFQIAGVAAGGLLAAGLALLTAAGICRMVTRKLGGLTGDTYGAINEIVEIVVLLGTQILLINGWLAG